MAIAGVYEIRNIATGDFYIGSSCNIERRLAKHRWTLVNNKHINRHLQNAWNKYSGDNFEFTTIMLCDKSMTLYCEQKLLDLLKPAYNIAICAAAPMQGRKHTEATIALMCGRAISEEHRRKNSAAMKGNTHALGSTSRLGQTLTEEHKHNLSEAWKTRPPMSEETRLKIGESQKGNTYALGNTKMLGKHHTLEARERMSEAMKGRTPWNKGMKLVNGRRGEL